MWGVPPTDCLKTKFKTLGVTNKVSHNILRLACLKLFILASFSGHSDAIKEQPYIRLEVIDPYVEMHTGPGRGYPVFYVIEQGEKVDVLTKRPDWYEVRSANGKSGWVTTRQISRTIQSTGEPADLPTVGYGDYLKDSWRIGFAAGQFSDGELEGADLYRLTIGYRFYSWLGMELEGGNVFGSDIKGNYANFNISLEPFSEWRVSPAILLGHGNIDIEAQPKLTPLGIEDSGFDQYAFRLNYYVGRNFVINCDYRWYDIDTKNKSVGLEGWQIGFNTFF